MSLRLQSSFAVSALFGVMAIATPAFAVAPIVTDYTVRTGMVSNSGTTTGSFKATGGGGTARVKVSTAPVPVVSLASRNTGPSNEADASAELSYFYETSFLTANTSNFVGQVFTLINGYIKLRTAGAYASAVGMIDADPNGSGSGVGSYFSDTCYNGAACATAHFRINGVVTSQQSNPSGNGLNRVTVGGALYFYGYADSFEASRQLPSSAAVVIDPEIELDSTFLQMAGAMGTPTLTLSPGVTNATADMPLLSASSAPEPASWLMAIVGFGLVGGVARRRGALVVA